MLFVVHGGKYSFKKMYPVVILCEPLQYVIIRFGQKAEIWWGFFFRQFAKFHTVIPQFPSGRLFFLLECQNESSVQGGGRELPGAQLVDDG